MDANTRFKIDNVEAAVEGVKDEAVILGLLAKDVTESAAVEVIKPIIGANTATKLENDIMPPDTFL